MITFTISPYQRGLSASHDESITKAAIEALDCVDSVDDSQAFYWHIEISDETVTYEQFLAMLREIEVSA